MKATIIVKLFLAISLLFLSSCKEYFITTKINSNGTVERSVACKIDQDKENKKIAIPETFLADSVWAIKTKRDSVNKRDMINAEIKFNSFEEAVKELNKPRQRFDPVIDIKIEKHFKFFFTYYNYRETYRPFNSFNKTPLEKYFNRDEIAKLKEGSDSAWVENKLEEYFNFNLIDVFFDGIERLFLSEYQIKFSDLITPEKRKELINEILPTLKDDKENNKKKAVLKKYFDTVNYERIEKRLDGRGEIENMLNSMSRHDAKYENAVILPGIITASNSKSIEGNRVTWKFDQEKFKFFEHEMIAESREANTWFIIASGAAVIILLGLLIFAKIRKKPAF